MRVACVYDGSIRDNGSPFFLRTALGEELRHGIPWYSQANPIPEGYDFYIHLDDGRDDLDRLPPGPFGFVCTDSHLGPEPRLAKARKAAITWCAQAPFVSRLQAEGLNARWLPLACSPAHHPTAVESRDRLGVSVPEVDHDVAFVGFLQPPDKTSRIDFLGAVFGAFPNFDCAFGRFHEQMAHIYHGARIGLNHAVRDDLNMRFFELASIGVPQLCDRRMVGLADLGFVEGEDYIGYESTEEAIEQVRSHLTRDLQPMAASAWEKVRAGHTYRDRAARILTDIKEMTC